MAKRIKQTSFTQIRKEKYSMRKLLSDAKYRLKQAHGRIARLTRKFGNKAQIIRNNDFISFIDESDVDSFSKIELTSLLSELNSFIFSKSSTIKGYKESRIETIKSFNDNGYKFVNDGNLDDFLLFLDDFKASSDAEIYGSDDAVKFYQQADRLKIDAEDLKDNMGLFADHFRDIQKIKLSDLEKTFGKQESYSSFDLIQELINKGVKV